MWRAVQYFVIWLIYIGEPNSWASAHCGGDVVNASLQLCQLIVSGLRDRDCEIRVFQKVLNDGVEVLAYSRRSGLRLIGCGARPARRSLDLCQRSDCLNCSLVRFGSCGANGVSSYNKV